MADTPNLITVDDVYSRMGTAPAQRNDERTVMLGDLIASAQSEFEVYLGRYLFDTQLNRTLTKDVDYIVNGDTLMLLGKYVDTYQITELYENDVLLTESTEFSDDGDYIFDSKSCLLIKKYGAWETGQQAIKATGNIRYGGPDGSMSIRAYLTEYVGLLSGIWSEMIHTPNGSVNTNRKIKSFDDFAKCGLKNHKLRGI